MKILVKLSMAILAAGLLAGCSQDFIPDQKALEKQDRVLELIGNFYQKVHNETRSGEYDFSITGVSTESYVIPDSLRVDSRSGSDSETFDIKTVTVDFGENPGYVILSDTPGIDRVFYYTEAGCVNDTTEIPPLKDLIDDIPLLAVEILCGNNSDNMEVTRAEQINIDPLVRFAWHQSPPFNNYAAYCTCESCSEIGNHMPIGCVTIAVGQTIATLKKFNGTFYGNRDVDFDSFPDRGGDFNSTQALLVAHFLQEIALTCQTQFTCKGSSATAVAAARCLVDNGYKCEVLEGSMDVTRFISNLKAGLPHIMGGKRTGGAHMWIIDGIKEVDGAYNIHINWGYGYTKSMGWGLLHNYVDEGSNPIRVYNKGFKSLYLGGVRTK